MFWTAGEPFPEGHTTQITNIIASIWGLFQVCNEKRTNQLTTELRDCGVKKPASHFIGDMIWILVQTRREEQVVASHACRRSYKCGQIVCVEFGFRVENIVRTLENDCLVDRWLNFVCKSNLVVWLLYWIMVNGQISPGQGSGRILTSLTNQVKVKLC